jgi:hypothetical protein
MNSDIGFQVVCTNCGCLSIKIEEPLKSSREAIVYCGDCGASRGSVGALRDLAVQKCPNIVFPTLSSALSADKDKADEPQPATKISTRYAELQRLREQVKIAEWLASESSRPHATKRTHKADPGQFVFRPSPKRNAFLADERNQKRPS